MSDNSIRPLPSYNINPIDNSNKKAINNSTKIENKENISPEIKDDFKNLVLQVSKVEPKTISFVDKSKSEMTKEGKQVAEKLTSLFENDTFELQYGYAEYLKDEKTGENDGRGITAGRAGFTTGTGDLYIVVKEYTVKHPNNPLAKYLPRLKELSDKFEQCNELDNKIEANPNDKNLITQRDKLKKELASEEGLKGLVKDWEKAGKDSNFRKEQDKQVDEMYYKPAMKHVDELGLKTQLAKAFVYDTIIQHGDGPDPDGINALIDKTNKIMHGSPKTGVDEKKWLNEFIKIRKADLAYANDPATRKVWSESTGRCDVFSELAKAGNYDLHKPVNIHKYNKVIK